MPNSFLRDVYVERERIESGLRDDRWTYEIMRVVNLVGGVRYHVSIWPVEAIPTSDEPEYRMVFRSLNRAKSSLGGMIVEAERLAARDRA